MAILHLLANPSAAASCLATARAGDALLLIGDGVFAAQSVAATTDCVGVLHPDAESRGVVAPSSVRRISYAEFVQWVVDCERSVTWR